MISNIIRRFRRAPLPSLAVLLMALVLSAALCGLPALGRAQQKSFEEMYASIPVKLQVTNLSATRWDGLDCPRWVLNTFTGFSMRESLEDYVKDVQSKLTYRSITMELDGQVLEEMDLVGITSPDISQVLAQRQEGIRWFDGYTAEVLAGEEAVCLIHRELLPEGYDGSAPLQITFSLTYSDGFNAPTSADHTMTVAGTHAAGSGEVYVPFEFGRDVFISVNRTLTLDAVSATLVDNDLLDEVREAAFIRFAEPNPTGEKTPWKWSHYFHYPYALHIDTSQLDNAEMTLKTNLLMGEICSWLIFVLAAGAGFFIGFLMIRQRKREIALMRTMGTPTGAVYLSFALEQMICAVLGALLGGAPFLWQPADRLGLFLAVYFVGLSLALLIFLYKNLITAIKEDE